jgi:hypothetical protein
MIRALTLALVATVNWLAMPEPSRPSANIRVVPLPCFPIRL